MSYNFKGCNTWRERLDKIEPGDIAVVSQRIDREDTSITYEIVLTLRSMAAGAYEVGDDQITLWSETVYFGQTDATVAGGAAFVQMAREQQHIANECRSHNG